MCIDSLWCGWTLTHEYTFTFLNNILTGITINLRPPEAERADTFSLWQMSQPGWEMTHHWWQMTHCGWQMIHCGWQMTHCGWQMTHHGWQMTHCGWQLIHCGWRQTTHRGWQMIYWGWQMTHCRWQMIQRVTDDPLWVTNDSQRVTEDPLTEHGEWPTFFECRLQVVRGVQLKQTQCILQQRQDHNSYVKVQQLCVCDQFLLSHNL